MGGRMTDTSGRDENEEANAHPSNCELVLHFDQPAMRRLAEQVLAYPSVAIWIDAAQRDAAAAIYARRPRRTLDREVVDLLCLDADAAFAAHWTHPAQIAPVTPDTLRAAAGQQYALSHWPEHAVSFSPVEATDPRRSTKLVDLPLNQLVVWTRMALPAGSTVDEIAVTLHANPQDMA